MPVLQEGDVEVWITPFDPPRHVRCYVEGYEIIVDLDNPTEPVTLEPWNDSLVAKALRVVSKNYRFLLAKWNELNL